MNCETIRQLGIADEYRAGRLSPEDSDAYEEHYFACTRCFEDLQFRDRVAGYLRDEGARLFSEELREPTGRPVATPPLEAPTSPARFDAAPARRGSQRPLDDPRPTTLRVESRKPRWWNRTIPGPSWAWGLGLVATSVFVAAIFGTQTDRRDHATSLAEVVAHPYVSSELRGEATSATFDAAMDAYVSGDYAHAAGGLEACARETPDDADVQFYLGVSQLLLGRSMAARASLQAAVRLAPSSSVYRWYLAQALLRSGSRSEAIRELQTLAAGNDEYATQARRLRAQLQRL